MRRLALDPSVGLPTRSSPAWLDLEQVAKVAVSSEDPDFPIEFAFRAGNGAGWRAGGQGDQTIRLVFDTPQPITRIRLRFAETQSERTQEFSIRARCATEGCSRELVRQQFTFSPQGATSEIEEYSVTVDGATTLELTINPDVSSRNAIATLLEWRIA